MWYNLPLLHFAQLIKWHLTDDQICFPYLSRDIHFSYNTENEDIVKDEGKNI